MSADAANKRVGKQLLQQLPWWEKLQARLRSYALLLVIYTTFWVSVFTPCSGFGRLCSWKGKCTGQEAVPCDAQCSMHSSGKQAACLMRSSAALTPPTPRSWLYSYRTHSRCSRLDQ